MNISDNDILNAFNTVLPFLPKLFDDEISFAITNRKEFLVNQSCQSLQLKNKKGDPIGEGGGAFQAITTGKTIVKEVPREVYGIQFRSYAIPINDADGNVVGAILAGKSLARSKEVLELSSSVSSSLEQISIEVNTITNNVQDLLVKNSNVIFMLNEANENAKGTNEILSFVKSIASQTNILGMNAAIEAGRAGESGRGFKVVANEIRKLSTSTMNSLKQINEVLENINGNIENISIDVIESNGVFEDQAASLQEISSSLQQLNETAKILEKLSKKL
jgi:copper chaperone CopZ